jgi:outer membrane protein OmpA-like peptidoglycan-associated protein
MRNLSVFAALMLAIAVLFTACNASNTAKGTGIGAGAGAAIGAGIGALIGHGKGAAWGAGIGAIVGGSAGAAIGHKMDKQKKELEALENAKVETINDGEAIRLTFESGILFATNKSDLNAASQNSLSKFAASLRNNPDTDVKIVGHTDNTGNDGINDPLSQKRADAVKTYLIGQSVVSARLTSEGRGSHEPVADNATSVGKAQNRRVEVYIMPNEKMIREAQQGTLK